MPSVAVLFAKGFEEIEAIAIVDVLRRAEIDARIVAVDGGSVTGSHGITLESDTSLKDALSRSWDLVVLPGGMPGSSNLRDHPQVQELIKAQNARGGKIGAICAAPIALGAAGLLKGKKATSYPGFQDQLAGAKYVEERVVRDGNIITSRGPGTALEFALELVAELKGRAAAESLRKGMLVAQ
jgi:4-methyl-5(b-hydroxyethyl)-thiazole monophosphate biosynthesis